MDGFPGIAEDTPMIHTPRMTRRGFAVGGAGLLLAPMASRPAHSAPAKGGTLRFLVDPEPTSLVPLADTTGSNVMLSCKVTEGLFAYNPDFSLRPQLAVDHAVSPDGREITFTLRQGVKWHDGQNFTADDVVFSLTTLKQTHPRGRATFANVDEVVATGPATV